MSTSFDFSEMLINDDTFVTDSDLLGFNRPRDIVQDPVLTRARKRQLLAHWASDIHAVPGSPALRSYTYGTTVSIDEIQAALRALDQMVDLPAVRSRTLTGASA
jgi:hypothetical protein